MDFLFLGEICDDRFFFSRVVYLVLVYSPPPANIGGVSTRSENGVLPVKGSVASGQMTIIFRTAVPFWGQTTWNLSSLSPKRDCGSKGDTASNNRQQMGTPPEGASNVRLPGRWKPDVLRPGIVWMHGSMVIRLRPFMISR